MNNGKDFSEQRKTAVRGRKHWNQTRRRAWEEEAFTAMTARHANLFNGMFSETSTTCLRRIAENTSVPGRMLEQLALHPEPGVREAVTDNPNTPIDTLWVLASDESIDVRYAMAENHNLPLAILSFLLEDENPYVACRARLTIDRLIGGTVFETDFWRKKDDTGQAAVG